MEQAQITVLRFPDNVRLRKEMYLIDPNHCLYEILDNAVDEHTAGRCDEIDIVVEYDGKNKFPLISVTDNGGGIPTSLSNDPEYKDHSQAYVALGQLTTSGKYQQKGGYETRTSGLHGVGAACVNAVSSIFLAEIYHDGKRSDLSFNKGKLAEEKIDFADAPESKHGTIIRFRLDERLWGDEDFDFEILKNRLSQICYLNPKLSISFSINDLPLTDFQTTIYYHPSGLKGYFEELTQNKKSLGAPVEVNKIINDDELGEVQIASVFGYCSGYSMEGHGFVNNVTTQAGDHMIGFTTGVARAITAFFSNADKYKHIAKNVTSEDCKEGLVFILSVGVRNPKFEGQSKNSIKMPKIRSLVYKTVTESINLYLDQHPNFVKLLAEKLEKAIKARNAAKNAREAIRNAKSALENSNPEKLAACSSKKPEECELYIVEGDSAAGSAKQGRDSKIQAILPVFGKILNTEKANSETAISNQKLLDVVKALRCGIGKTFDIHKLRYHKVILMADAD